MAALIALALAVTHALCVAAGGWYVHRRYLGIADRIHAAQTAIRDERHLTAVLADYGRQLRAVRLVPRFHVRNAR